MAKKAYRIRKKMKVENSFNEESFVDDQKVKINLTRNKNYNG